ncbi:MAG: diversity-generating retroelement protein Avd [Acaryochloridaceae cyanobacterium CSU_3_4]|nr:diversity-generating retroelement protein Avd [Acaryochloridaceae cyanobacterium CSU_3_4]
MSELSIIQHTYEFLYWYTPILNRLPRDHKLMLGNRIMNGLYDLLEQLIIARYERDKLSRLEALNSKLDILRHQTRLLSDFELLSMKRYQYAGKQLDQIGGELGGWIKQQRHRSE